MAPDTYEGELVKAVREMTERMVEFRQDMQRSLLPLYPRIREIEDAQAADRRLRTERQQVLDAALESLARSIRVLRRWAIANTAALVLLVVVCIWLAWRLAHAAIVAWGG